MPSNLYPSLISSKTMEITWWCLLNGFIALFDFILIRWYFTTKRLAVYSVAKLDLITPVNIDNLPSANVDNSSTRRMWNSNTYKLTLQQTSAAAWVQFIGPQTLWLLIDANISMIGRLILPASNCSGCCCYTLQQGAVDIVLREMS